MLDEPGVSDITLQFEMIVKFGFISNIILLLWILIKLIWSTQIKFSYQVSSTIFSMLMNTMWMTQFIMLLVIRFSQSGRVCSGDYIDFIGLQQNGTPPYSNYYMIEQGEFLRWYSTICLSLTFGAICCFSGCITCSFGMAKA